jgi:hypothetical protein
MSQASKETANASPLPPQETRAIAHWQNNDIKSNDNAVGFSRFFLSPEP